MTMTYNNAFAHALIGYGIRRKCWTGDLVLAIGDDRQLYSVEELNRKRAGENRLVPTYQTLLTLADYRATDWETI
jgi:hypothetical protein